MSVRSSAAYTSRLGATIQDETGPANGANITVINTRANNVFVIITPSGLLTSLTLTFPNGEFDGQSLIVVFTTFGTASLNFAGALVGNLLNVVTGNGLSYVWANNKWNRWN